MTDRTMTSETSVPTGKPPRWVNALVRWLLRTPGLERWVGKEIALITVTGRRTGKRYEIPVTYDRQGDRVVMVTKRFRTWWPNLAANPDVELSLAGTTRAGRAEISVGDSAALPVFIEFLEHRPRDARAYGVTLTPDGKVDEERAAEVLDQLVIITVQLVDEEAVASSD